MMVSSPYLAFSQADHCGTSPALSSPMNSHVLVVCSLRPLLGNTDTTPGYPEMHFRVENIYRSCMFDRSSCERVRSAVRGSLAISAAWRGSRLAAKPLMCLVYE